MPASAWTGGRYMARTSARLWRAEAAFVAACQASVCSAVTARAIAHVFAPTPARVRWTIGCKCNMGFMLGRRRCDELATSETRDRRPRMVAMTVTAIAMKTQIDARIRLPELISMRLIFGH